MRNESSAQTPSQQKAALVALLPELCCSKSQPRQRSSPGARGSLCHLGVPQLSILCHLTFLSASLSCGTPSTVSKRSQSVSCRAGITFTDGTLTELQHSFIIFQQIF